MNTLSISAEAFHHIATGAMAVANDCSRGSNGAALAPAIEPVNGDRLDSSQAIARHRGGIGGMDAMDPVHVGPVAITTVHNDPVSLRRKMSGPFSPGAGQKRLTGQVHSKGPRHSVDRDVREFRDLFRGMMRDQVNRAFLGEETSQLQIRPIHSAMQGEIPGNQHPPHHREFPVATSRTRTSMPI